MHGNLSGSIDTYVDDMISADDRILGTEDELKESICGSEKNYDSFAVAGI